MRLNHLAGKCRQIELSCQPGNLPGKTKMSILHKMYQRSRKAHLSSGKTC